MLKYVRPLFEQDPIKDIKDIRIEKFNYDKILWDVITLFESDNEGYFEPIRIGISKCQVRWIWK